MKTCQPTTATAYCFSFYLGKYIQEFQDFNRETSKPASGFKPEAERPIAKPDANFSFFWETKKKEAVNVSDLDFVMAACYKESGQDQNTCYILLVKVVLMVITKNI